MRRANALTWLRAFLAVVLTAGLPVCASAQGFMVKPMTMETDVAPNQTATLPLEIYNTALDGPRRIVLRLVDLSQDDQGTWRLVEPGSGINLGSHASSVSWTALSEDSVEIAPQQPAVVTVRLRPPANARGYYFAGIIAETPVSDTPAGGVVVRVRFLIPLIIEIRGRSVRQNVSLNDVSMTYRKDPGTLPTTTAALSISNQGQTFSRVRGEISIERQAGDAWRLVTRVPVKERGIIPGVTLKPEEDLQRRLPSGTYRLRASLFVDGRRAPPVEKEVSFSGDPNVDSLAYDTALMLEPGMVRMDIAPGATRTTVVKVTNPGEDPVSVRMDARMPRALLGVAMGERNGSDFSAVGWTEVRPTEFTIQPGRWQNVRVMSRVPRAGADQPNYYADLVLNGTYRDGQSAGETRSTVHLVNRGVPASSNGLIDQVSIAEAGAAGLFAVQVRFANTGNIDLDPKVRCLLLTGQGGLVRTQPLSGEEGTLLPFGKRIFSAEMSFAGIDAGDYTLRCVADLGGGSEVDNQQTIAIATDEGAPDGVAITVGDGSTANAILVDPPSSAPQAEAAAQDNPAGESQ